MLKMAIDQWLASIKRPPTSWPRLPRYGLILMMVLLPLLTGWFVYLAPGTAALQRAQQEEQQQKILYQQKLRQTSSLPQFQNRLQLISQLIEQSQQQLIDTTDLNIILGELATIAAGHQLRLELAKPAPPIAQQYLIARPLQLRLLGHYHDLGKFAAAVAASAHPLLLKELQISPESKGSDLLRMEATVFVHRQTEPEQRP